MLAGMKTPFSEILRHSDRDSNPDLGHPKRKCWPPCYRYTTVCRLSPTYSNKVTHFSTRPTAQLRVVYRYSPGSLSRPFPWRTVFIAFAFVTRRLSRYAVSVVDWIFDPLSPSPFSRLLAKFVFVSTDPSLYPREESNLQPTAFEAARSSRLAYLGKYYYW